jgi:DHA1 family tetracycline resistance protein-like MFS transporter
VMFSQRRAAPDRLRDSVPSVYALLTVALVDSFSYSMILPILPYVVFGVGGGVKSGGFLMSISAVFSMVSGLLLGRLSDRIGRRIVILLTLGLQVASYLIFAFAWNLVGLFASRALEGISTGNGAVLRAALADETTQEDRGRAMAKLTAAVALGFVVGPGLTVILPKHPVHPTLLPGIIAAVGACISLIFVIAVYRPSKADVILRHSSFSFRENSDEIKGALGRNGIIAQIGFITFCQTGLVAMTGFFVTVTLSWDQRQLSLLMLGSAGAIIATQMLFVPLLLRRCGEAGTVLVSFPIAAACAGLLSLHSPSSMLVSVAIPLLFCSISMTQTSLTTRLSNITTSDKQGATLGVASSSAAVGQILGPIALGVLFDRLDPRAPYGTALVVMVCLCAWVAVRNNVAIPYVVADPSSTETD